MLLGKKSEVGGKLCLPFWRCSFKDPYDFFLILIADASAVLRSSIGYEFVCSSFEFVWGRV